MSKNARDLLDILRLIIHYENGSIAHRIKEFIEDIDILEEAIDEE
jgi:hypothetical protein